MALAHADGRLAVATKKKKRNASVLIVPAAVSAFCLAIAGSSRVEVSDPTIEYANAFRLARADVHLEREVRAGVYVVEVREADIDIRMRVATDTSRVSVADQVRRHGLLLTVVRLNESAAIRIRLENADHPTMVGTAEVRLLRLPYPASSPPGELELGYSAMSAAEERISLETVEARKPAVEYMRTAIAHFAAAGDVPAVAQAQYSLASLQWRALNEWRDAIRSAEQARDTFALLRNARGVNAASTLRASAEIELAARLDAATHREEQLRLFARANQTLLETARYFHEQGLAVQEENAVNMRGVGYYYRGDLEHATTAFESASTLAQFNHDVNEELVVRGNLGAVRFSSGYATEAPNDYRRVLQLLDRERKPYQFAVTELTLWGSTL
jgi:tetratricopeptide (TPR) repeat protein